MRAVPGVFNVTDPRWNILVGNGSSTNRTNLQAIIVALLRRLIFLDMLHFGTNVLFHCVQ
jgi:hypothetical protein